MPARTPAEAAREALDQAERWLSCVTRSNQLLIDGHSVATNHIMVTPGDQPTPLRSARASSILVRQWGRFRERDAGARRWELILSGYSFTVHAADGGEAFAYHWHPGPGFISFPHLHVNADSPVDRRMHLPTAHVGLNDVIAFLIREYGVAPLRRDWEALLTAPAD